jgi:hypothetical protein
VQELKVNAGLESVASLLLQSQPLRPFFYLIIEARLLSESVTGYVLAL